MNDSMDAKWAQAADGTPDVFGLPKIAPQGEDGVAHFAYYNRERSLMFEWDGFEEQHITVSHGGFGEPVKWTFDFMEYWRIDVSPRVAGPTFIDFFRDACWHFQKACDNWIAAQEDKF
jgi:hypothetical protein